MRRNKIYSIQQRFSLNSQAPCFNWMVPGEYPFLESKWVLRRIYVFINKIEQLKVSQKNFEASIQPEAICTNKTITQHLRKIEIELEAETSKIPRKEVIA